MTGCAMSVKWSALWYIILFMFLIVIWEVGTRRSAGAPHPWRDTLLDETGWIVAVRRDPRASSTWPAGPAGSSTDHGYDRHWLRRPRRTRSRRSSARW